MERSYVNVPQARHPWGEARKPFSDAVLVGDTLYISGRVGFDPQTARLPAELAEEARNIVEWLASVLAAAEMTINDLAYVQIFAPDVAHFDAFNEIYLGYFDGPLPARAFIGSGPLLFGARFQVTGIAVKR